jgi:hypothetical protein
VVEAPPQDAPADVRFAPGQRVRSRGPYHAGEVGTVVRADPDARACLVEFAGGALVFARVEELEPAGAAG